MTKKKTPTRHRQRWSEYEDTRLTFYWGHQSLTWIAKRLSRTEHGVGQRVRKLGLGPAGRSTFSMRQLIEYLGVSESRIRRAAQACEVRLSKGKRSEAKQKAQIERYGIDVDTVYVIEAYLAAHPERLYNDTGSRTTKGKWGVGKKPAACVLCNTTNFPHFAKGQCTSCYQKRYKDRKYYTRWMVEGDIESLMTFAEATRRPYEFREVLLVESQHCRVARGNIGDLRGYVLWAETPWELHVFSIAVHPDHRRRGVAKNLLEDAIHYAKGRSLVLEVRVENEGAIQLYKSQRFEILGRKIKYYDDGGDAYVMAKLGN